MDGFDNWVRFWRERYCWPLPREKEPAEEDRAASEKRILQIEDKMRMIKRNNQYFDVKHTVEEIAGWKVGPSHQEEELAYFERCDEDEVALKIYEVLAILEHRNPDDVASAMNLLVTIKGVGIPVASAILRFLDPDNHRYGVIDTHVASFLNDRGITSFELDEKHRILKYPVDALKRNIGEYRRYHDWLQKTSDDLRKRNVTYRSIDGTQKLFQPVDIDMAIFAFSTQKPRFAESEAFQPKDLEMDPKTLFTNIVHVDQLLKSLTGVVQLLDKDIDMKGLMFMHRLNPPIVRRLQILCGKSHLSPDFKEECKAFISEMNNRGILTEIRVLDDKDAQEIHDRYLIADNVAYNTPPWNVIHKKLGDIKRIDDHRAKRQRFDVYWSRATEITRASTK